MLRDSLRRTSHGIDAVDLVCRVAVCIVSVRACGCRRTSRQTLALYSSVLQYTHRDGDDSLGCSLGESLALELLLVHTTGNHCWKSELGPTGAELTW